MLDTPIKALFAGALATLAVLLAWVLGAGVDRIGFLSFVLRWLHVLAAMIWVGHIWFMNFTHLIALQEADDAGRATLHKLVAPRVAAAFRHSSHLTVLSGLLLLVTTGYLLDRWMFTTAVFMPPLKNIMLWGGTLVGVVMWALVHFVIWPAVRTVLAGGDAAMVAAARARAKTYARINLILALPVTFVMVAAAHLY